ncbi:MAG: imidazole glycerol phosphate synthase subunit HisH [Planctomycetes bacterium]|nr:imidazole glycerol phosphate synthase subunit HisH [Planctomycetota bacterium]
MIAVVDYGMGNLRSVQKAVEKVGFDSVLVDSPEGLEGVEKVVLPGVGAFRDAMQGLSDRGLIDPILRHIREERPFLGICLGLHVLFTESEEDGPCKGLGVIPGKVVKFRGNGLRIPHMGWNQVCFKKDVPITKGIPQDSYMYFVHSYYVCPDDPDEIAAVTEYGGEFPSAICKGNIFATQFHPEKSQANGLTLIKNFAGG